MLLKNNVKDEWWRAMIQERDDIVALDSAILMHPRTWEASGHLEGFTDPLVQCLGKCKRRWREDHLRESAEPGEDPTSCGCPECGGELTEPREFNLMFETTWARCRTRARRVFLRPETAQGIFLNFKNVLQFARKKPPFGIAQVGKSFRNEITPGNFIFRTREFEQMEMEFFVPPAEAEKWHEHWMEERHALVHRPRHPPDQLRLRAHGADELSHYSAPRPTSSTSSRWAGRELEGIANRGDFDLTQHAKHSGEKLEYVDTAHRRALRAARDRAGGRRRPRDAGASSSTPTTRRRSRARSAMVLRLHPRLAPVKVAVLPLVNKDGQPEMAREIYEDLRTRMPAEYDAGGSIGKRYRRQDEIGTPWGVTVDHQTLEDDTVTLRDRDSLEQVRIAIDELGDELERRLAPTWRSPKLATTASAAALSRSAPSRRRAVRTPQLEGGRLIPVGVGQDLEPKPSPSAKSIDGHGLGLGAEADDALALLGAQRAARSLAPVAVELGQLGADLLVVARGARAARRSGRAAGVALEELLEADGRARR